MGLEFNAGGSKTKNMRYTLGRPIYCDNSWNKILIKIRDDEDVVSSVMTIALITDHGIASAYKSCEKN